MLSHVLIIDQTPADSHQLRDQLRSVYGCKCSLAGRTSIGLEELQIKTFDLIILDIDQPDGEDIDIILKVSRASPQTPLLVVSQSTGNPDPALMFYSLRAGAHEFVPKRLLRNPQSLQDLCLLTVEKQKVRASLVD